MFNVLTLFGSKITFWIVFKLILWVFISTSILSIFALMILIVFILILRLFGFIEIDI